MVGLRNEDFSTQDKKVSRDVVHDLLDWQRVVEFFKEVGPGHLTVEVVKTKRSIKIKQNFL